jgi:hypothetical protein
MSTKDARPSAICGAGGVAATLQADCGEFVRVSVLERLPAILETTCELNAERYDPQTLQQIREMAATIRYVRSFQCQPRQLVDREYLAIETFDEYGLVGPCMRD